VTHVRQAHKNCAGRPQPSVSIEGTSLNSPSTTAAALAAARVASDQQGCENHEVVGEYCCANKQLEVLETFGAAALHATISQHH
jgi:hypothetical protein